MWLEKNEITNLFFKSTWDTEMRVNTQYTYVHTHHGIWTILLKYYLSLWRKVQITAVWEAKGLVEVRRSKRRLCVWGQNAQVTYRVTFSNKQNKILSLMLIKSIIALHYHLIPNVVICTKPLISSVFDSLISLI